MRNSKITVPYNIETRLVKVNAGQEVIANVTSSSDGHCVISLFCGNKVGHVVFDNVTEARDAGWKI